MDIKTRVNDVETGTFIIPISPQAQGNCNKIQTDCSNKPRKRVFSAVRKLLISIAVIYLLYDNVQLKLSGQLICSCPEACPPPRQTSPTQQQDEGSHLPDPMRQGGEENTAISDQRRKKRFADNDGDNEGQVSYCGTVLIDFSVRNITRVDVVKVRSGPAGIKKVFFSLIRESFIMIQCAKFLGCQGTPMV